MVLGCTGSGKSWLVRYGITLARGWMGRGRWREVWVLGYQGDTLWEGLSEDLGPRVGVRLWRESAMRKEGGEGAWEMATLLRRRGGGRTLVVIDEVVLAERAGGEASSALFCLWEAARDRGATLLLLAQEEESLGRYGIAWKEEAAFVLRGPSAFRRGGACGEEERLAPGEFQLMRRRLGRGLVKERPVRVFPPPVPWRRALLRALGQKDGGWAARSLLRGLGTEHEHWLRELGPEERLALLTSTDTEVRTFGIRTFRGEGAAP